jgi:hypothetical protein
MADDRIAEAGLAHAVARFPDAAVILRRLALADREFREICVEYQLALACLAGFEARPDAGERPEVEDYRTVIAELEVEIGRLVRQARG